MTTRNRNNPSGPEPGRETRKDEELTGTPYQANTPASGGFNETQRTGYGTGIGSSPTHLSPASTSRREEGDEDYDDEDAGKDYDDYNREYERENEDI
ncbi:hypothetical protein V9K67_14675 [Paraflavisolibacter sp. H34]|uniref:hypothetical protein n=1 Tax=Huijunlia imazamoxiresistens TaxID=3127457 RepID=UPI003015A952